MLAFDIVLGLLLVVLVWQSLNAADLFRAVISFMAFGLLMAVAWVRLSAPDIALAEAAIGAGLTGALVLSTLGRLPRRHSREAVHHSRPSRGIRGWLAFGFWWGLAGGLVGIVFHAVHGLTAPGLGEVVEAHLAASGVANPVTAVLLNFRSLDTLMEIGVLLLAVMAMWSFGGVLSPEAQRIPTPILGGLVRILAPAFVLVAAYLVWRGSHAPGGAFPAGAVLAAGGILLLLAGASFRPSEAGLSGLRWLLASGLLVFLLTAFLLLALGEGFLVYPEDWAGGLVLLIEVVAAIAIGAMLTVLYLGGEPAPRRRNDERGAP